MSLCIANTGHWKNERLVKKGLIWSGNPEHSLVDPFYISANRHHRWNVIIDDEIVRAIGKPHIAREFSNLLEAKTFLYGVDQENKANL